jgi:hypothetical protein
MARVNAAGSTSVFQRTDQRIPGPYFFDMNLGALVRRSIRNRRTAQRNLQHAKMLVYICSKLSAMLAANRAKVHARCRPRTS